MKKEEYLTLNSLKGNLIITKSMQKRRKLAYSSIAKIYDIKQEVKLIKQ